MLFKDCQKGYPVFLLDRNEITATQGKIIDVSRPHFDNQNPTTTQMVVDVTIEVDGKQMPPFVMSENAPIAYTDKLILSTDRDSILREVEAVLARNEEELSMVDVRKQTVEKCKQIIEDWNPEAKERRQTNERMTKIEDSVQGLRKYIEGNDKKMDKILSLLQSK